MRLGFFFGLEGDRAGLRALVRRLAGCDRIVSLGNLVGGRSPDDLACWMDFVALGPRGVALAAAGERRLAQAPWTPPALRRKLRRLDPAAFEQGVVILGPAASAPPPSASARRALGATPQLIASLAIAAHPGETRLWRGDRGLARSVSLEPVIPLGEGNLRLELGRSLGAEPVCAILDLEARRLELHPIRAAQAAGRRRRPRRSIRQADERQGLLAV